MSAPVNSVSKGVFSFPRKIQNNEQPQKQYNMEKNQKNNISYKKIWSEVQNIFESCNRNSLQDVVSQILDFIQKDHRDANIPVGVFLTGVNLPDHGQIFDYLVEKMIESGLLHVTSVESTSVSTLRALIAKIVDNLSGNSHETGDDLPSLFSWYKKTVSNHRIPLIIIFRDFENFPNQMMQDFILNIREFISEIPFRFVFGIATNIDALHQSLSVEITSSLSISSFSSLSSSTLFSILVNRILISNNISFKVGPRVFQLLYDIFLFHDFSVKNFLFSYKFCLLEHFLSFESQYEYILNESKDSLSKLSSKDYKCLRKMKSFLSHVKNHPGNISQDLMTNDKAFLSFLKESLCQLEEETTRFNIVVSLLHSLTCDLPQGMLGKNLHTVYLKALSDSITQSHEYRESFSLMKHWSRLELISRLMKLTTILSENEKNLNSSLSDVHCSAWDFIHQLKSLENSFQGPISRKPKLECDVPKKWSRSQWQESLKDNLLDKKSDTSYETIKSKVLDFLHNVFSKFCKSPILTSVFHELKFFDKLGAVKQHLIGDPRSAIQIALTYPSVYLENEVLNSIQKTQIQPELPDICIAFKLYLECGKLINLYDWFQCWLSVVKDKTEMDERLLQARFTCAVSELQYLGFINPSKRKTDHVTRLAWGST